MIVIVDYGLGNLGSIMNMLKKVGAAAVISSDLGTIERADKLILPGVGGFDKGMQNLAERGLIPVLNAKVLEAKTPIIGLCLGLQLFSRRSEEGQLPGLGWVQAETVRFKFDEAQAALKVPHMSWNTMRAHRPHPLLADMDPEPRFYFAHAFHLVFANGASVLGETHYGYDFTSAIAHDNILGVQFHPEKSHRFGMRLLKNFAERC